MDSNRPKIAGNLVKFNYQKVYVFKTIIIIINNNWNYNSISFKISKKKENI